MQTQSLSDRCAGIYIIRNFVSGRCYVGSALNIRSRWRSHRHMLLEGKHHSPALQRSWQKHGEGSFRFGVIENVADKNILIKREQFWMDILNTTCPLTGFNVHKTAGSPLGMKRSLESRSKQSAASKGRKCNPFSDEHKAALSRARTAYEASTGRKAAMNKSPEMREKVRAASLKRYSTPEGRAELKAMINKRWAMKRASGEPLGHPHSEETKMRLSIAKKGRMTPEHKAAIAASNKQRALDWKVFGPALHP